MHSLLTIIEHHSSKLKEEGDVQVTKEVMIHLKVLRLMKKAKLKRIDYNRHTDWP